MMLMKRLLMISLNFLALAALLIACSGKQASEGTSPESPVPEKREPITITFYNTNQLTDTEFRTLITNPAKKKFPHITINRVSSKNKLEDLISSGQTPDIIYDNVTGYYKF